MQIKELSKMTELSISTIRYYENLNLISPKKKEYYKEYTDEIKEQLLIIKKFHTAGLKLSDIQLLFSLNEKDIDRISLLEINQIKDLLNSSIEAIIIKQEQLKNSKEMLEHMLGKVNILYENCK